jgi:pimeloyl-ACP methyl ester carboxylesterase
MRTLLVTTVVTMVLHSAGSWAQTRDDHQLPRRAALDAVIRPPTSSTPAQVLRIAATSALYRAGLRAGDEIAALDGQPFADAIDFDRRMAAIRGGQRITFAAVRKGQRFDVSAQLTAMPLESLKGVEAIYTHVRNPRGLRQRAILTRPTGTTGRAPAILFVPWLSCDSIESPDGASPGIDELLQTLARESGWAMLRVDKPGVGDSEGACADTDLDTEIDGSRAALKWLASHPWIDATRIVIMGQSFSGAFLPLVAADTQVAGYIVLNSWVRTWMERLLEFERLQVEASGVAAGDVSERQRKLVEFYSLFLEQQKTPRQVMIERPDLASVWDDMPEHQYGRPARFHHQLQRINAAAGWSRVAIPTLVMWGDADLVMHRTDHEPIVALVNRNRPNAAELVVVPGANHGLAARDGSGRNHLPPLVPDTIRRFLDRLKDRSNGSPY